MNKGSRSGVTDTMPLKFIDLFAGIGGIRTAFEDAGAMCVFSSEWDKFAKKTYATNFGENPVGDIRQVMSNDIPYHDILLAGFPCQPFSISGVSKKNSLGMKHGFDEKKQGNLFFEIERILEFKQPEAFMLENVKHLRRHDKGNTFKVIQEILDDKLDYKIFTHIVDAQHYVPQHRERIFIVGFKRDVYSDNFEFKFPNTPKARTIELGDILLPAEEVDPKYTITDKLWQYLQDYKEKHRRKGNGFGFGLVNPSENPVTRTLSARYYKDGSEILIYQPGKNPRRLTPRECAHLMGFDDSFEIPVSDTQAYKQFGNSVVVPVVRDIAREIVKVVEKRHTNTFKVTKYQPDFEPTAEIIKLPLTVEATGD
jgi:DNA (cytosine-5)-methyltransferase 1